MSQQTSSKDRSKGSYVMQVLIGSPLCLIIVQIIPDLGLMLFQDRYIMKPLSIRSQHRVADFKQEGFNVFILALSIKMPQ